MKQWGIGYLVSLYAIPATLIAFFLLADGNVGAADACLTLFPFALGLNILLGIGAIAAVLFRLLRGGQSPELQKTFNRMALLMKLPAVPFFGINLLLWLLVSAAFLVIPGLQIFLLSSLLGVAFAYFVVLVTSAYSVGALYLSFRAGGLTCKGFVWGILLQLIFVADVISYLFLYFRVRRQYRPQNA